MSSTAKPDLSTHDTLPKVLRWNTQTAGGDVAMREKQLGLWRSFTWAEADDRTRHWALGMRQLGIGPSDVVGIIGDSRPDWIASAIGAHALRAMTMGIYQDSLDAEVEYLINYSGCRMIVAEDEEQVDKILNLADRIPTVERIVYCNTRGMRKYDDPRLTSMDEMWRLADELAASDPGLYDQLVDATRGDDVAVLCTTSGTTSNPKLAMVTGGRMIRHVEAYNELLPLGPADEYVSVLPMAWIGEQFYGLYMPIVCRVRLNFVEEPETLMADMREIGPSFMLLAPRVWEQIAADVRARMIDASPLKRRAFDYGMKVGLGALEQGRKSTLAHWLLFRALKDRLGFSNLRYAATGGAALGPDTFKFFQAMGVPLLQLYGQTEMLGAQVIHRIDDVDFDTVGKPLNDQYELRIDKPDANGVGEIICRSPNMFTGYYKNEAATAEAIVDGWLHTGDAGFFNEAGHLVVIDRIKDIAITARGDRFSPQFIENKLKFSPYIAEAVVLGHGRDYLSAIVCIRFDVVSRWAEQRRIAFTTYSDLSSRAEVRELIGAEVEKVNATLPPAQQVRKFLLLYKELDADDGELTRTRKVRRGVVGEKYGDIVDAIYGDQPSIDIDTVISFQDGTKQRIKTQLEVVTMRTDAPLAQAAE
ncbi:MAG: AMP-binding protein [Alphaproteobacteria bacterium]